MSQRQQLERIFEIDRRIRAGEYPNAATISQTLEVSKRVIYMDREFMVNRLGAPIEFDRERGGWFYTNATWSLPNIMVTEGELLAFFLSVEVARRYLGTALEGALRSAVDKITQGIKGPVSVDLETLKDHYTFTAPALASGDELTLMALHQAIRDRQRVWMRYYTASRDERTERTVSPYHLYNIHGDWYLVAFDDLRNDFRNFSIGRIEDWKILDSQFERDGAFSTQDYMGRAFQTERGGEIVEVVIRFDSYQARYMRERCWHASQEIEELPDGGLILRFRTAGLDEVLRWVMQYGSHAEVLGPDEFRESVKRDLKLLSQIYR